MRVRALDVEAVGKRVGFRFDMARSYFHSIWLPELKTIDQTPPQAKLPGWEGLLETPVREGPAKLRANAGKSLGLGRLSAADGWRRRKDRNDWDHNGARAVDFFIHILTSLSLLPPSILSLERTVPSKSFPPLTWFLTLGITISPDRECPV